MPGTIAVRENQVQSLQPKTYQLTRFQIQYDELKFHIWNI